VYKKFFFILFPACSVYKKVRFSRDVLNTYSIYNLKNILMTAVLVQSFQSFFLLISVMYLSKLYGSMTVII